MLAGTFTFFGLAGPVTVYYLPQILASRLAEMRVVLPPLRAAQGMTEYAETLSGIGLIVVVAVAAGALCLDAHPTLSTFYRTRTAGVWRVFGPRYGVTAGAAAASFIIGALAAWYETALLLGPLAAARVLTAVGLGVVFLSFAVAVVALSASVVRSTLATAGLSLCLLYLLPIVAIYDPVGRWSPSKLTAAFGILDGTPPATYAGPALVAFTLTPLMLVFAVWRHNRREI